MVDNKADNPVRPVETLTGEDLNQAFGESIRWLRSVAECRWLPRKLYRFPKGTIHMPDPEIMLFQVKVNVDDGSEVYYINADSGLVSLRRETNSLEVQSSVLGRLEYEKDFRYFVCHMRKEQSVSFGTMWLKKEAERNPFANWAMEEMKRAAIKVVKVCQG